MKTAAVLLAACIVLAGVVPVSAAPSTLGPTMYALKTTVAAIVPYTHGNGVRGCTIVVARGMNGNTLTTYDNLCALTRGAKITLNYSVGSTVKRDWRGRTSTVPTYTFCNAYAGW